MRLQQSTFYKYGKIVLLFYLLAACCAKVFGQNKQKEIDRLIVQVPMLMRSDAGSAKSKLP